MGAIVNMWRLEETVKPEHFYVNFGEEWTVVEKYDRLRSNTEQDLFSQILLRVPLSLETGMLLSSHAERTQDTGLVSPEGFMTCFKSRDGGRRLLRGTLPFAIFSNSFSLNPIYQGVLFWGSVSWTPSIGWVVHDSKFQLSWFPMCQFYSKWWK